jgi:hypothetical protein
MDYHPWESLNERTFSFNLNVLDRYALKPAAKLWSLALPEEVRHGLANAFDNLAMPKRFVNKVLQRKAAGSGRGTRAIRAQYHRRLCRILPRLLAPATQRKRRGYRSNAGRVWD